jgi:hypothetical protein
MIILITAFKLVIKYVFYKHVAEHLSKFDFSE